MSKLVRWPVAILGIGIFFGLLGPAALAAPQASISDLLMQGYEVKGTLYIPTQDAMAGNPGVTQGQVLITLQKGQSIAVCQFNWTGWSSIANSNLALFTRADRCDVPGQP